MPCHCIESSISSLPLREGVGVGVSAAFQPKSLERDDNLIHELHARIARMAAFYARCSGIDADDLLQDAWVCVLEAQHQHDGTGLLKPWLIRRARWRMLDVIKHHRFRQMPGVEDCDGAAEWVGDDSVLETKEFAEQLSGLQQRILRSLVNGRTWREAGAELGCTSANIAYHVREIRRRYQIWSGHRESSLAAAARESS
jgi:DNA-directed RNA polymerase specialized sigma24 family protein